MESSKEGCLVTMECFISVAHANPDSVFNTRIAMAQSQIRASVECHERMFAHLGGEGIIVRYHVTSIFDDHMSQRVIFPPIP